MHWSAPRLWLTGLLLTLALSGTAQACLVATMLLQTSEDVRTHFDQMASVWQRLYRNNANVFEATVVARQEWRGGTLYRLQPLRAWKSDGMPLQQVLVPPRPPRCKCMCGPEFEVGGRYIIFAERDYWHFKIDRSQGGNPLRVAQFTNGQADESGMSELMLAKHGAEHTHLRAYLGQLSAVHAQLLPAAPPTPAPRRE